MRQTTVSLIRAALARVQARVFGGLPPLPERFGAPEGIVLAVPARGQVVYRIVGRSTPRLRDFQSGRERELPRAPNQNFLDYVGISVFGSEAAALENAAKFPKLVAEVVLPSGQGFSIARTFADIDEHYSVWGDPEALLGQIIEVSRTDEPG